MSMREQELADVSGKRRCYFYETLLRFTYRRDFTFKVAGTPSFQYSVFVCFQKEFSGFEHNSRCVAPCEGRGVVLGCITLYMFFSFEVQFASKALNQVEQVFSDEYFVILPTKVYFIFCCKQTTLQNKVGCFWHY